MYVRWEHADGRGLFNNQSLDYDKLDDDEYAEIEELYLTMQQPPSGNKWGTEVVFAFEDTAAEGKFARLIELAKKASKTKPVRKTFSPREYEVAWESGDGQVAIKKRLSKRDMSSAAPNPFRRNLDYGTGR